MTEQDETVGSGEEAVEGVDNNLSIEMETDPETQVTRISMSGTLTVEVTPVVDERGSTIYVIGGTQMKYVKRKSALETALRHHVGQSFDNAWSSYSDQVNNNLNKTTGQSVRRQSKSSQIDARLDRIESLFLELMESRKRDISTGDQNGNHETDISSTKVRVKA